MSIILKLLKLFIIVSTTFFHDGLFAKNSRSYRYHSDLFNYITCKKSLPITNKLFPYQEEKEKEEDVDIQYCKKSLGYEIDWFIDGKCYQFVNVSNKRMKITPSIKADICRKEKGSRYFWTKDGSCGEFIPENTPDSMSRTFIIQNVQRTFCEKTYPPTHKKDTKGNCQEYSPRESPFPGVKLGQAKFPTFCLDKQTKYKYKYKINNDEQCIAYYKKHFLRKTIIGPVPIDYCRGKTKAIYGWDFLGDCNEIFPIKERKKIMGQVSRQVPYLFCQKLKSEYKWIKEGRCGEFPEDEDSKDLSFDSSDDKNIILKPQMSLEVDIKYCRKSPGSQYQLCSSQQKSQKQCVELSKEIDPQIISLVDKSYCQ